MATRDGERTVQPSLLDRLIDLDPKTTVESRVSWARSVERFKESVRRDLEWLLNSRQTPEPAGEEFPELDRSLFHYGLPDISSMSADSDAVRQQLVRQVEHAVSQFEPRLAAAHVTMTEEEEGGKRHLRFTIEAMLRMDPSPEQVVFDTVLEIASGEFHVTSRHA